jgi:hypothetical protein
MASQAHETAATVRRVPPSAAATYIQETKRGATFPSFSVSPTWQLGINKPWLRRRDLTSADPGIPNLAPSFPLRQLIDLDSLCSVV